MTTINLGFSPCPNDTFIFDAMVHHKIDTEGLDFNFKMADVDALNHMALRGDMEMCKVSYHAFLYLMSTYTMLDSGSAMGFGNGPLIISRKKYTITDLEMLTIAIPGEYTTAHLLLKIAAPLVQKKKVMVFNEIEDAILSSEVDAGVIIHENRFTYEKKGLIKVADLGEYWDNHFHSPVPLGGIIAKKSLGQELISKLNRIMRRSVAFALQNPNSVMAFVRKNAQEMDEEVMKKHIGLYVNDFTVELGEEGKKAVQKLFEAAKEIIPV
jgi:1,4-dihydroxy-6-naphthoate synthase